MTFVEGVNKYDFLARNSTLISTQPLTFPSGYFYKIISLLGQSYTLVRSYIHPVFADNYKSEIIEYNNSIFSSHEHKNTLEFTDASDFAYWSLLKGDWSVFLDVATKNSIVSRNCLLETTLKSYSIYRSKIHIKSRISNHQIQWDFLIWPCIINRLSLPEKSIITHSFLNAVMKMKLFTEGYLLQKCELIIHETLLQSNSINYEAKINPIVNSWIDNNDLQEQIMISGGLVFVLSSKNKSPVLDTHGIFDDICEIVIQRYHNHKQRTHTTTPFEELQFHENIIRLKTDNKIIV
jgi:hypothetical protein